ncbi:hypothetical protein TPHA_0M01590 [Tetrapisispora phaffii CBS 4417]|uniref:histone deacetylase n=1 Tax=Tetrapisispora phaffii (strain ATCC 24235 / CBS 4417 / NBRC 1672 / NRRL Y-8282 / UCD 70-5) TaxID=1071381 RepID=G8C0L9_TETPH|nr:hypothetical protein TPHA_0M01590 [Tetrapisispora phaffii CBS 4417]CCE65734.1 hypothetical protein TPHA_0M01590 [Tetrapisispora phaffii CBS 4417]
MGDENKFKLIISTSHFQSSVIDLLPCNHARKSKLINSLLEAYQLISKFDVVVDETRLFEGQGLDLVEARALCNYHSQDYLRVIFGKQYNERLSPDDNDREGVRSGKAEQSPDELHDLYELYQSLHESYVGKKRKIPRDRPGHVPGTDPEILKLEYNLNNGDCPIFSFLPMYLDTLINSTMQLAKHLCVDTPEITANIAINWDGGRHHAMKSRANGFCYINDIVSLINELRKTPGQQGHKRKLTYIDLDLHHGDGVENAFNYSKDIQIISIHLFEPGFYPCTGGLKFGKPKSNNIINLPVKHGLSNSNMFELVTNIIIPLIELHQSDDIVILCGGDGLNNDYYNEWQLTIIGLTRCIIKIIAAFVGPHQPGSCKNVVLLGGGGYNELLASRFYTYLTYKVLQLAGRIPPAATTLAAEVPHGTIDDKDKELLIKDHEHIDEYEKEYYKYWCYEIENGLDGLSFKRQINYNDTKQKPFTKYIAELRAHYGISRILST